MVVRKKTLKIKKAVLYRDGFLNVRLDPISPLSLRSRVLPG